MENVFYSLVSVGAVVVGVAGLVVLALGIRNLRRAAATKAWQTTTGEVSSATVATRESTLSPTEDGEPPKPRTLYRADVTYRYTVQGRAYEGRRVGFDDVELSSEGPAQAVVDRYAPGTQVTVSFDPANPADAVLEPGVSKASLVVPALGAALVAFSLGVWAIVRFWSGR